MSIKAVDVQILGRQLKLTCPAEEVDALNAAAEELNKRLAELKEKTQLTNTDKLLMSVALNICYELNQEKAKNSTYTKLIEARLHLLERTIEDSLVERTQAINQ